jgi:hypothetical protein
MAAVAVLTLEKRAAITSSFIVPHRFCGECRADLQGASRTDPKSRR